MNVISVAQEIPLVTNSMIGESPLPDFPFPSENRSERMRIAAFDELNGVFEGHVACWS
jgi:hypothetical protein